MGTEEGARPVDYGYLQQIAQTADRLRLHRRADPDAGRSCEDVAGRGLNLIPVTPQRLKFLVALRPSVVSSPTVAASGGDRLSNGRALFNLVTGSDHRTGEATASSSTTPSAMSLGWAHPHLAQADGGKPSANGKHQRVRDAKLLFPPLLQPRPPLYFGGSSGSAGAGR
ncbi:LLM class flavin-dependent oxidoreductase [Klebsiella pneumoniae]|nr:LLM class flavin-dependent oxidoreductase [Klebsiella pneumoniae]